MNYNLYINILYKVDHAKYTPHNNDTYLHFIKAHLLCGI